MLEKVLTKAPAGRRRSTARRRQDRHQPELRDAWFVGYTPQLVARRVDGQRQRGADAQGFRQRPAGQGWQAFMTAAHREVPARALPDGGGGPAPKAPRRLLEPPASTLGIQG